MKKLTTKKLTLKKESVRRLNETELRRVAGGAPPPSVRFCATISDNTGCCPCIHTSAGPTDPILYC